jgi:hypothetical protein
MIRQRRKPFNYWGFGSLGRGGFGVGFFAADFFTGAFFAAAFFAAGATSGVPVPVGACVCSTSGEATAAGHGSAATSFATITCFRFHHRNPPTPDAIMSTDPKNFFMDPP